MEAGGRATQDAKAEGLMVTCPLAPGVSHLISTSCPSSRDFALGFLQTLPHDSALA